MGRKLGSSAARQFGMDVRCSRYTSCHTCFSINFRFLSLVPPNSATQCPPPAPVIVGMSVEGKYREWEVEHARMNVVIVSVGSLASLSRSRFTRKEGGIRSDERECV